MASGKVKPVGTGADEFKHEVFPDEVGYLRNRWKSVYSRRNDASGTQRDQVFPQGDAKPAPSAGNELVGLAFSGGGIRSATVNLGIAQALHRRGVLDHVDYLSTVSGGGYLGSSLSTIMRDGAEFPYAHSDGDKESPYLVWLRNHSNYLATRGPIDLIRLFAILVRGVLVNFLVLVPLLLLFSLFLDFRYGSPWKFATISGNAVWGKVQTALNWVSEVAHRDLIGKWASDGFSAGDAFVVAPLTLALLGFWFLVFPVLIRVFKVYKAQASVDSGSDSSVESRRGYEGTFAYIIVGIAVVAASETMPLLVHWFHQAEQFSETIHRGAVAGSAGGASIIGLSLIGRLMTSFSGIQRTLLLFAVGLLGLILPMLVVLYVAEGLIYEDMWGNISTGDSKVWLLPAVLVGLLFAGALASAIARATEESKKLDPDLRFGLIVVSALVGFALPLDLVWVHGLAPLVCFIIGGVVATVVSKVTERPKLLSGTGSRVRIGLIAAGFVAGLAAYPILSSYKLVTLPAWVDPLWFVFLLAVLLWLYSWLSVDINLTAVLGTYRDRLSEAYLVGIDKDILKDFKDDDGKPRPRSRIGLDEITVPAVAIEDDLDLEAMCVNDSGNEDEAIVPYHIVNTTLNLQGSKARDVRERNADFLMFSKLYYGGPRTGYCRSKLLEKVFPQMDLATAMTISAAAASPNMGKQTNWALVMIMTLFNVRLGYWVPHPGRLCAWGAHEKAAGRPVEQSLGSRFRWRIPPMSFVKEMFGALNETWDWVNLSDGGHLENMAGYELLRRRCKYVIIGDAEGDPKMNFKGLADLKRFARLDLGVEIEIYLDDMRLTDDGTSHQHCAFGEITYPPKAPGEDPETGYLLYFKSSFTGDEDEVIFEYRKRSPTFPHESTADQFFSEVQFEAYRSLGFHMADGLFPELEAGERPGAFPFSKFVSWFRELEANLAPTVAAESLFLELQSELSHIQDKLQEKEYDAYFYELNPELAPDGFEEPPAGSKRALKLARKNLYLVGEQLRLMENVFAALDLERPRNWDNPGNSGWKTLFERWAGSRHFRTAYESRIRMHSAKFQEFCVNILKLPKVTDPSAGVAPASPGEAAQPTA